MADPPVPPQAMHAAAAAVPFVNRDAIRRILQAAAPLLAAAEREACAQLALAEAAKLRAEAAAESELGDELRSIGANMLVDFAARLREGT